MSQNSNNQSKFALSFEDFENGIDGIFGRVWINNHGQKFAEKTWEILENEGLTEYSNDLEKIEAFLRFMALGAIYREFNGIAFDEYVEPDYEIWAELFNISEFRIGQIIADNPSFINYEDEEENIYYEALRYLGDKYRPQVYNALKSGFGSTAQLFYELYLTGMPDEDDPFKNYEYKVPTFDEVIDDVELIGGKIEAYRWIEEGCYPYY